MFVVATCRCQSQASTSSTCFWPVLFSESRRFKLWIHDPGENARRKGAFSFCLVICSVLNAAAYIGRVSNNVSRALAGLDPRVEGHRYNDD